MNKKNMYICGVLWLCIWLYIYALLFIFYTYKKFFPWVKKYW